MNTIDNNRISNTNDFSRCTLSSRFRRLPNRSPAKPLNCSLFMHDNITPTKPTFFESFAQRRHRKIKPILCKNSLSKPRARLNLTISYEPNYKNNIEKDYEDHNEMNPWENMQKRQNIRNLLISELIFQNNIKEKQPLFVISTKNKNCINKRTSLGKAIESAEICNNFSYRRYKLNRGDKTTIKPKLMLLNHKKNNNSSFGQRRILSCINNK